MNMINNNTGHTTPSGWCILHTICFINSCIFTWVIAGIVPPLIDGTLNPLLIFGLFPLIMSIIIHVYTVSYTKPYKYNIISIN